MTAAPTAFISHADEDVAVAEDLCRHLERAGVQCWIAPRDVTPGQDYASEIVSGIESCGAFVLLLSAHSNDSPFVRREVERAASKRKTMFPVRLEAVQPSRALELFVSSSQWIDARQAPRDAAWERIARAVKGERERHEAAGGFRHRGEARRLALPWRSLALAGVVALAAFAAGVWVTRGDPTAGSADDARRPAAPRAPAEPARTPATAGSGETKAPPSDDAPDHCPQRLSVAPDLPTPYRCICSAEATRDGTVWGSDLYTDDSVICRAALHAGAVDAKGGTVTVERVAGRDIYPGTLRHGVRTYDYGSRTSSIRFAGTPEPADPPPCPTRLSVNPDVATPYDCTCSPEAVGDGTVWGTDVYTGDSMICRAALHAGKLTIAGGTVTLESRAGREIYAGTSRNGVTTYDHGKHSFSIRFR